MATLGFFRGEQILPILFAILVGGIIVLAIVSALLVKTFKRREVTCYHDTFDSGIYCAVMPFPNCAGCLGGMTELDALTSTSSHELCEAITDPVPGQGWYDDNHGEIGDICAWRPKKLENYTVQLEWSNRDGDCK